MAGDASNAIRGRIKEKEQLIMSLKRQLSNIKRMTPVKEHLFKSSDISQGINYLYGLLAGSKKSLPLAQIELKNLLHDRISIHPKDIGNYYKIKGLIKARLGYFTNQPLSVMLGSGTGNSTVRNNPLCIEYQEEFAINDKRKSA